MITIFKLGLGLGLTSLAFGLQAEETGSIEHGQTLYQEQCRACHTSTMGRFFSGSPKITQLSGDYILTQLQLFASGQRPASENDKSKNKMLTAAKLLSEQDRKDIVAYIEDKFQTDD